MALTLSLVREYISDLPRVYPPAAATPEVLGIGDGANTTFYLAYPNVQTGTLVIYFGTLSTQGNQQVYTWTAQAANTYAQNGQQVTFNAAVPSGTVVGARYQATALSDTLVTEMMNNNVARYSDDQTALKGCMNDYLDVLLGNLDLIKLVRYADYMEDARQVVMGFDKIKAQLQVELEGNPRPGRAVPYLSHVAGPSRRNWGMQR